MEEKINLDFPGSGWDNLSTRPRRRGFFFVSWTSLRSSEDCERIDYEDLVYIAENFDLPYYLSGCDDC
jgi:hypothetical protein